MDPKVDLYVAIVEARHRFAQEWCRAHGKDMDTLTIDDVLEISKCPDWIHPSISKPEPTE